MVQNGISQILVMERGTLRERGTYAELTADPDSVFNSLLQQQQTPDDDEFSIARYIFMTAKQKLVIFPHFYFLQIDILGCNH